jgi:hypothetical protein
VLFAACCFLLWSLIRWFCGFCDGVFLKCLCEPLAAGFVTTRCVAASHRLAAQMPSSLGDSSTAGKPATPMAPLFQHLNFTASNSLQKLPVQTDQKSSLATALRASPPDSSAWLVSPSLVLLPPLLRASQRIPIYNHSQQ